MTENFLNLFLYQHARIFQISTQELAPKHLIFFFNKMILFCTNTRGSCKVALGSQHKNNSFFFSKHNDFVFVECGTIM